MVISSEPLVFVAWRPVTGYNEVPEMEYTVPPIVVAHMVMPVPGPESSPLPGPLARTAVAEVKMRAVENRILMC